MENKITEFLEQKSSQIGFKKFRIAGKEEGESNHNFIIESGGEKYVLRLSKEVSRRQRLENESKALKMLEQKGIENVPRLKFFSKEAEIGQVLLETFVGEKDISFAHRLNRDQIKSLANILANLHSIEPEETGFDGERRKSLRRIYREEFRRWSERPYREYLEIVDEPDPRIERFYRQQKQLLEQVPEKKVVQGLIHSDLGFNLRVEGGEVFIVDWEYAEIGYPGHDLMILFEHGRMDGGQRMLFMQDYRKKRSLDEGFEQVRQIHPKFLAFHDLVWAARRNEKGEDREDMIETKIANLNRLYDPR